MIRDILVNPYILFFLSICTTHTLGQGKEMPHSPSTISSPLCGYDLKCLQNSFMRSFRHSESQLIAMYGRTVKTERDSSLGSGNFVISTLIYHNFSVCIYAFKSSSKIGLREVAIWDSSLMAKYGFAKGMTRDSVDKLVNLNPEIWGPPWEPQEFRVFTTLGRYYFAFDFGRNGLEKMKFGEYADD